MKNQASNPTRWSLIVRAQGSGPEAQRALGELLRAYDDFVVWLFRYLKHPPDISAEDLKQAYFARALEKKDFAELDRKRGSFRGYLNTSVRRFLCNEWDHYNAKIHGRRGSVHVEFDAFRIATVEEDLCNQAYVNHLVRRVLAQMRQSAANPGRFEQLVRFLPGPQADLVPHESCARALGITTQAFNVAISKLRAEFCRRLRADIRDTLDPDREPVPEGGGGGPKPRSPAGDGIERAIHEELRELLRYFTAREHTELVLEAM